MFNFWINIQLWGVNLFFRYWYYVNCWIWSSWFKFFWSLLPISNHSCGYWSSCGPDNLPLHGACGMHPTSCHWEKIYCFLSSSHFGFPGIHACKYLFFMLLWFLVVATSGLSQCSVAKKERDFQRGYHIGNISSWKVTNAHPEVFESCAWGHKRPCRSSLYSYNCVQSCPYKLDHKLFTLFSG